MKELSGTGIALCTPFTADKQVDFSSLEKLVENNISNGVDYLVALGTTSETATLSKSEKKSVVDCILSSNGNRIPVVLGIGGNDTKKVNAEIKETNLNDFSAILSVSPYYNKPNQTGLYQHYEYLAKHTDANIIIYNVPSRTGSNINPETTLALANNFSNLIGIKDAPFDFRQFIDVLSNKPNDFMVISGDDLLAVPAILAGAVGVISVTAQAIPAYFSKMINHARVGNTTEANQMMYEIITLIDLMFEEGNPTGIKALLSEKGIANPYSRLPVVEASENLRDKILNCVNHINFKL